MTKEQLEKWRGLGFPFPPDYDTLVREELKKDEPSLSNNESKNSEDVENNEVEIGFVKYLFRLRNANYYKKIVPYTRFSGPNAGVERIRVFIAGKIFPILNISYSGEDADATKIQIKNLTRADQAKLYFPNYNSKYIDIDNGKIKIFLPISYGNISFETIMHDFLTNGSKTAKSIGGEFLDYSTYKLALREDAQPEKKWLGEDGCWLKEDRTDSGISARWMNGIFFIVKNKVSGRLAPFKQIFDFYEYIDGWLINLKHEVKWCKGAKTLVKALAENIVIVGGLEGGSNVIFNEAELILNELNLGICDFAISKFHELIFGNFATTPLKGDDAYEWDLNFVTYEQQVIASPIYNKSSRGILKIFQSMADRNPVSFSGLEALLAQRLSVIPAFDDFDPPAKIQDPVFRTDLPLLMLYLDKHKPTAKSFAQHLNSDGTLNEKYKSIIRPYAL